VYGDGPDLFVLIYFAAAPHGSNACHQSNAIHIPVTPTHQNITTQHNRTPHHTTQHRGIGLPLPESQRD
jgi:hypothetical protein